MYENKPQKYEIKQLCVQTTESVEHENGRDVTVPDIVLDRDDVFLVLGDVEGVSSVLLEGMCANIAYAGDGRDRKDESRRARKRIKKIVLNRKVSVYSTSTVFNILYLANNQHSTVAEQIQRTSVLLEQLGLSACFYMSCSDLNKLYHTLVAIGVFVMQGYDAIFLDSVFCGMSERECEKLVLIVAELAKYYGILFVMGSDGYGRGDSTCDAGVEWVCDGDHRTECVAFGGNAACKTGTSFIGGKCFKALVVNDFCAALGTISGISHVIKDVTARSENLEKQNEGRQIKRKNREANWVSLMRGIAGNFRLYCVVFQMFLVLIIFVGVVLMKNSLDPFRIELLVPNVAGSESADVENAITPIFIEKEHNTNCLVICATLISFALPIVPLLAPRHNVQVLFANSLPTKRIISLNVLSRLLHEGMLCLCFALMMSIASGLLLALSPIFSFLFIFVALISARLFYLLCTYLRFDLAVRCVLYVCLLSPAVLYPFLLTFPLSHEVHKFIAFLPQVSVLKYMHALLYVSIRPQLAHEHMKAFSRFLNMLCFPVAGDYRMGLLVLFLYLSVLWMVVFFVMKSKLRRAFRIK
ncbi:hypothetical protein VCUG_01362 [Vavraia culicis subsp. floridensis]|uniref:ABC transporter domain-containing protein n=1 Tax=Vavraia culicis (isolate floridensis) TaxID=948595 RepID=L2GV42_VAVCU|nr:uncharacterized protein VCUG_01362 [Vavraia culicis subsp. floridensis]ELA47173.1 hypothetical protein VCUG_01362 [Vavraia culicis subsp. floridensis]